MNTPIGGSSRSDGVVRSSALAFLDNIPAQEQAAAPVLESASAPAQHPPDPPQPQPGEMIPPGLRALCAACTQLYPGQQNPLQVTTRLKYWLGGQDPLDYISMYWNEGNPELRVPPHWHYISFGLSDLHGDGRVHTPPREGAAAESGWGLEFTMRLRAEPGAPPLWPAALMQALARYIFYTGNKMCAGDHISWHAPLDGHNSRLRHLLVAADPQLPLTHTPHGSVTFLQLVGCTSRELHVAQNGSANDVMDAMRKHKLGGGAWLVSDGRRRQSCARAGGTGPAHLAGVAAVLRWSSCAQELPDAGPGALCLPEPPAAPPAPPPEPRGHCNMSTDSSTMRHARGDMSTESFEMSSIERALPDLSQSTQWWSVCGPVTRLPAVHLQLNPESAALIPLAIRGRVLHGRHFTWQAAEGGVTVLCGDVSGAVVCAEQPYAARGRWLQVYLPKDLAEDMAAQPWSNPPSDSETDDEDNPRASPAPAPPYTRTWPQHRLRVSVLPDHCFC